MSVVALIPARGGSKRVPRKNIRDLGGKPLIAWSIHAATESVFVDRVIVSTDDPEIAHVAHEHSAEVPFLRPPDLSSDRAKTGSVVLHAVNSLCLPDHATVVILQPTSPFRSRQDIDAAFTLYQQRQADGVVSVCECEHSPLWSNTLSADGNMEGFLKKEILSASLSDIPRYYRLNGAIYVYNVGEIRKNDGLFYSSSVYAYVMPSERSLDIDTEYDFTIAQLLTQIIPSL